MIGQLGRLHAERLGVIARTSVMRYKAADRDVDQIGRELGVAYVLEGSVRREADRVRIHAQLIRVNDRTSLWAETYERDVRSVILDIVLPGLSGYEVCRMVRGEASTRDIPIIMLTARVSESDKVLGLELGADDYITKPFGIRELIARVRAAIRRKESESETIEIFDDGKLYIHFGDYLIRFNDCEPKLTFKEFNLLKFLVQNPGRVLSREKILNAVWGYNYYGESRTVDVHIRRIRKKLGQGSEDYIDNRHRCRLSIQNSEVGVPQLAPANQHATLPKSQRLSSTICNSSFRTLNRWPR